MSVSFATLAVVFDFDDTLVPDSTTLLLEEHGIHSHDFWLRDVKKLVVQGYDPAHAYLKVLLDNIGIGKRLGSLTSRELRRFGTKIERKFHPGLAELLNDLRGIVGKYKNIDIEFYIISGGLQDIIEGSKLVAGNFSAVYASQLAGDKPNGVLKYIKRCITFTEKTRYLFEINKGVAPAYTRKNPYAVNEDVQMSKRKIPFANMVYVGDGLTDIPCFSLVSAGVRGEQGGVTFGVFDPAEKKSAKRIFQNFLIPRRVVSANPPQYRRKDALGSLTRRDIDGSLTWAYSHWYLERFAHFRPFLKHLIKGLPVPRENQLQEVLRHIDILIVARSLGIISRRIS